MALIRCALKGVSMKAAYPVITRKVDERLILRYRHILDDNKRRLLKERSECDGLMADDEGLDGCAVPKIVWFSWLQGLDKAPEVVRVCLASQKRHPLVGDRNAALNRCALRLAGHQSPRQVVLWDWTAWGNSTFLH